MNSGQFEEILAAGHERRYVEFKPGGPRSDGYLFAKIARAMMGMANHRNGGQVILGVEENPDRTPRLIGFSDQDLATWTFDDVCAALFAYADPNVDFELDKVQYKGMSFVVISISEFERLPILCKKSLELPTSVEKDPKLRQILRVGACYVRSLRKPETAEIPSLADMRALLDLAIEKGVRQFVKTARAAGLAASGELPPTDDDHFQKQLNQFLAEDS